MLSCSACGDVESVNGGNDFPVESASAEVVTTDPDAFPADHPFYAAEWIDHAVAFLFNETLGKA